MNLIPTLFSIVRALIVLALGVIITKIVVALVRKVLDKEEVDNLIRSLGYDVAVKELLILVLRYLLYFVTFLIAIAQFGFGTLVIEAMLIIIVLSFGFVLIYSLKDLIPNISAGITLARSRAFKVGDKVKIGLYEGIVREFTITSTKIEDKMGRLIIIPNSIIIRREIINEGIHLSKLKSRASRRTRKSASKKRSRKLR